MNEAAQVPFRCVYCGHDKPEADFDNEHVFSRALCGSGANWTLVNLVCKTCNNRFSGFENELLQQSAETIARGFSGPLGRGARTSSGVRIQPLKVNHLYAINAGDTLVYEGGFSFPSEFYFRPQMLDVGDGTLLSLVADRSELVRFQEAVSRFASQPKRITLPRPPNQKEYQVITFEEIDSRWHLARRELVKRPSNIFFREFIQRPNLPPMTPRLAQNDDGNLFIRASEPQAVGSFIDLLFANKQALPRPPLPPGPGHQTFFFGLQIDLIKVYKAVLKTGLNLVTHFYGEQTIRNGAFNQAREIVLETPSTNAAAICKLYADVPQDFPRLSIDAHQMMLDEFDGSLRFRMRLYNSFGYAAKLATMDSSLHARIGGRLPKRVVIEFGSTGIREVQTWP